MLSASSGVISMGLPLKRDGILYNKIKLTSYSALKQRRVRLVSLHHQKVDCNIWGTCTWRGKSWDQA